MISDSSDPGATNSQANVSPGADTVEGSTLAPQDGLETEVASIVRVIPGGIKINHAHLGMEARMEGDAHLNTYLRDEIPDDLIVEREDVLSAMYKVVDDKFLLEFCRNIPRRPLQEDPIGLQALVSAYPANSHALFMAFGDNVIEQTAQHRETIGMYRRFFEDVSEANTAILRSRQLFECGRDNLYQIVYHSGLANRSEALAALSRLNKIATKNSPEAVARNIQTYTRLAEIFKGETTAAYEKAPLKLIEDHAEEVVAIAKRNEYADRPELAFGLELGDRFPDYFTKTREPYKGLAAAAGPQCPAEGFDPGLPVRPGAQEIPLELLQAGEWQPDMDVRLDYKVIREQTGLQRVGRALANGVNSALRYCGLKK